MLKGDNLAKAVCVLGARECFKRIASHCGTIIFEHNIDFEDDMDNPFTSMLQFLTINEVKDPTVLFHIGCALQRYVWTHRMYLGNIETILYDFNCQLHILRNCK